MSDTLLPAARPLLDRWIYVMVRVGKDFLAPYTPAARDRILAQGGYGAAFGPFLERFLAALAGPDWSPGSYYPGGWARMLEAQGEPLDGVEISPETIGPFFLDEVVVEADGRWRVGPKWLSGPVLRHFLRNLRFDEHLGRYQIRYRNVDYYETRYIHHHSPPFRVERIERTAGGIVLHLNDDTAEPLRPETLRLDDAERLYAAVKPAGVPALFQDAPRWQVLDLAEERDAGWVLLLDGGEVPLALHEPMAYAGQ